MKQYYGPGWDNYFSADWYREHKLMRQEQTVQVCVSARELATLGEAELRRMLANHGCHPPYRVEQVPHLYGVIYWGYPSPAPVVDMAFMSKAEYEELKGNVWWWKDLNGFETVSLVEETPEGDWYEVTLRPKAVPRR